MRSPRRTVSRCSAVYSTGLRSADALRFVDEFRPLSLLIPLCTIYFPSGTRRDVSHTYPGTRLSSVVDENAIRNLLRGAAYMHPLTGSWSMGDVVDSGLRDRCACQLWRSRHPVCGPGRASGTPWKGLQRCNPFRGTASCQDRLDVGGCTGIRVCMQVVRLGELGACT